MRCAEVHVEMEMAWLRRKGAVRRCWVLCVHSCYSCLFGLLMDTLVLGLLFCTHGLISLSAIKLYHLLYV